MAIPGFGGMQTSGQGSNLGFENKTTTTTYDPWVTAGAQGTFGQAQNWLNQNPYAAYQGPMSAGFGPETGQASGFLSGQLGQVNPYTMQAGGALQSLLGGMNPNASVGSYMSPFVGATLNPTLSNLADAYNAASGQNAQAATMAGSYGGTGQGVRQALLDKYYGQNVAGATANAYNQAWQSALQQKLAEQGLFGNMAGALGALGQNVFGQGTTLAGMLAALGGQQQQAGQQGIQNAINLNTLNQTLPLSRYGQLAGMLAQVPKNMVQNTTGTSYGMNQQQAPNYGGYSALGSMLGSLFLPQPSYY